MPNYELYPLASGSYNPSGLTNLKAGGAGSATTGTTVNPGISAAFIEQVIQEVLDVTAPTLIGTSTQGNPAPAGKLLVWDPYNSAFGSQWKLNSVKLQACGGGQFGIVVSQAQASMTGTPVTTVNGNACTSSNAKALVVTQGPVQAFLNTTVTNTAISAGMALAADGAGNLTYAGASPAVGTVLAVAADAMAAGVSVPVLKNVFVGGY